VPGLSDFRRPLGYAELAAQSEAGPIVLVNVSRYRSDAMILMPGGVQVVPLGRRLHQIIDRAPADCAALSPEHLLDLLVLLWDEIAEPVLDRLGHTGPRADGSWPRVWWCPTGALSGLPLHAAGRYDGSGRAVPDRVVSSYTPTIRALKHARASGRPMSLVGEALTVVAMVSTPGEAWLEGVRTESDWLKSRFPDAKVLRNGDATRDRVLAEVGRRPVAHFACHGRADPDTPSESRLLLHDHQDRPLTVGRLAGLDLAGATLAYLSACEAAQSSGDLADEMLHLASACQLAGFPQVVGTLWQVDDLTSQRMTELVYTGLAEGGEPLTAAVAVHDAVSVLRAAGAAPHQWVPYVHVGV
jgi:CHAT domain-containing protein